MPRAYALALVAAVALAAAGCATSPCQDLGEKLCMCQPGMTQDSCKTQVQDQLNALGVGTPGFNGLLANLESDAVTFEDYCQKRLDACVGGAAESQAADFCEFLLTETGKNECGVTPAYPYPAP